VTGAVTRVGMAAAERRVVSRVVGRRRAIADVGHAVLHSGGLSLASVVRSCIVEGYRWPRSCGPA
jgi:hypothetical protein